MKKLSVSLAVMFALSAPALALNYEVGLYSFSKADEAFTSHETFSLEGEVAFNAVTIDAAYAVNETSDDAFDYSLAYKLDVMPGSTLELAVGQSYTFLDDSESDDFDRVHFAGLESETELTPTVNLIAGAGIQRFDGENTLNFSTEVEYDFNEVVELWAATSFSNLEEIADSDSYTAGVDFQVMPNVKLLTSVGLTPTEDTTFTSFSLGGEASFLNNITAEVSLSQDENDAYSSMAGVLFAF